MSFVLSANMLLKQQNDANKTYDMIVVSFAWPIYGLGLFLTLPIKVAGLAAKKYVALRSRILRTLRPLAKVFSPLAKLVKRTKAEAPEEQIGLM